MMGRGIEVRKWWRVRFLVLWMQGKDCKPINDLKKSWPCWWPTFWNRSISWGRFLAGLWDSWKFITERSVTTLASRDATRQSIRRYKFGMMTMSTSRRVGRVSISQPSSNIQLGDFGQYTRSTVQYTVSCNSQQSMPVIQLSLQFWQGTIAWSFAVCFVHVRPSIAVYATATVNIIKTRKSEFIALLATLI